MKSGRQTKATAKAKGKAKAKSAAVPTKPVDTNKHDRSPQKADQASPNPTVPKRKKGKQNDDDPMKTIQALQEASLLLHEVCFGKTCFV